MVCTLRVSEKDPNGACAKAMAACLALPLLLGKESDVWFLHLQPEPDAAALLQPSAYEFPGCSLWEETSLILRLDLRAHPHLSGYQHLLPSHARNLCGSKSACVMLPPACSERQGHCWLLCPMRHQGWALGATRTGSHWARRNTGHFK